MGRCIAKIGGKYLIWSSVVDAPVTYGMTMDEIRKWHEVEYGESGMSEFDERIKRVEASGTSLLDGRSVESLIRGNRAGEDESELTLAEIAVEYCTPPNP